ncbi:MAG: hypothetical protein QM778_12200 [Myxococcales bacterium]
MSMKRMSVVLGLLAACGDGGDDPAAPEQGAVARSEYAMETVELSEDLVIPAGQTVHVGPGVTFTAKSAEVKVDVLGTLIVEGSEAAPSIFEGTGESESWHGIVVEGGGNLTLQHAQVSGAKYGMFAMPGSAFNVDHVVFDTSFKAAVLESDGSVSHSTFRAVPLFPAVTEEVSVDDPNGCMTIINASPTVTDCRFEGSGGLNDMIRVGGQSSPTFDHLYIEKSHCGFHMSGGINTSPRISNTVFTDLAYGIMAFTMKPIVEGSVFIRNSTDIGLCSGATAANVPMLQNNFFEGGTLLLDASCNRIGTKDASPASAANASAGPSGL